MPSSLDVRSNRVGVRNPVATLPATQRLARLPADQREGLRTILLELRQDAQARADACWRRHKAPMAAYWKAVAVYAGHLARVLR